MSPAPPKTITRTVRILLGCAELPARSLLAVSNNSSQLFNPDFSVQNSPFSSVPPAPRHCLCAVFPLSFYQRQRLSLVLRNSRPLVQFGALCLPPAAGSAEESRACNLAMVASSAWSAASSCCCAAQSPPQGQGNRCLQSVARENSERSRPRALSAAGRQAVPADIGPAVAGQQLAQRGRSRQCLHSLVTAQRSNARTGCSPPAAAGAAPASLRLTAPWRLVYRAAPTELVVDLSDRPSLTSGGWLVARAVLSVTYKPARTKTRGVAQSNPNRSAGWLVAGGMSAAFPCGSTRKRQCPP
eukprot:SAG22_NODE_288_length_12949_cov_163.316265_11_plen_299_part_00